MSVRSIIIFLLVFIGVAGFVVPLVHFRSSASGASTAQRGLNPDGSATLPQSPVSSIACTGPAKSTASHVALQDIADRARELASLQHPAEALQRYDDLQQLDPGYPGLQMDRATALISARRYDEALRAVNLQVSVSQCLNRLPAAALDSYCTHEMPSRTPAQCRVQLQGMERSAHFQAAIAQMQLGRMSEPAPLLASDAPAAPAREASAIHRSATLMSREPAPGTRKGPPAVKARTGDPLAGGEGTDAALGAYSH